MRLLLVDDDASLLNVMNTFLTRKGHQVETAVSGRDGWEIVSQRNEDFDVVITDKTMPDGNGLVLMGQIQKQFQEMPVVLISGDFDKKTSDFPFDENKYFFLPKPFELRKLEAVLLQILGKNPIGP